MKQRDKVYTNGEVVKSILSCVGVFGLLLGLMFACDYRVSRAEGLGQEAEVWNYAGPCGVKERDFNYIYNTFVPSEGGFAPGSTVYWFTVVDQPQAVNWLQARIDPYGDMGPRDAFAVLIFQMTKDPGVAWIVLWDQNMCDMGFAKLPAQAVQWLWGPMGVNPDDIRWETVPRRGV